MLVCVLQNSLKYSYPSENSILHDLTNQASNQKLKLHFEETGPHCRKQSQFAYHSESTRIATPSGVGVSRYLATLLFSETIYLHKLHAWIDNYIGLSQDNSSLFG